MYSDLLAEIERETLSYRDISIEIYGSGETDQSGGGNSRAIMTRQHQQGSSGHSSPALNMSEVSQPSIHQHIANNILAGSGGGNGRDFIASNTSPTYSHHAGQGSYYGREDQSAADHVVLYTILRELCSLRMALIGM
jgi:hypothetical protein